MLNTDDSWLNPSKRAKEYLDKALEGDSDLGDLVVLNKKVIEREEGRKVGAEKKGILTDFENAALPEPEGAAGGDTLRAGEARNEEPILEQVSNREQIRVLVVTRDTSILEKGSLAYQRIAGEREVFFELHIIVVAPDGVRGDAPVFRPFENVWVYRTTAGTPWGRVREARRIAESQLVFSGGFRADIVIGDDLFEAGFSAWYIAHTYKRPFQLHIQHDFLDPSFVEEHEHPSLYELSMWHLLRNVGSVRTQTEFQKQAVIAKNPDLEPVTELLPTYHNLQVWKDLIPSFDLHEKYPQFKFILLHISSMRPNSHSLEALLGAAKILRRYPTIGLIIVGNGPLRADLERQVIALGLQNKVEFEPMPAEVISHMKTANVLIHLSEDGSEENLILEGAVAKIPLILSTTGLGGKLFKDGESACLCEPGDSACVADSINRYLNENQERASFALTANEIVFERIEQDYNAYLDAYRDSVERAIVSES